jgi:hypothetical protein
MGAEDDSPLPLERLVPHELPFCFPLDSHLTPPPCCSADARVLLAVFRHRDAGLFPCLARYAFA